MAEKGTELIETATEILGVDQSKGIGRRVAAASNPLLMRLRLAALLIVGHKEYPDALSRLTNLQVGVFALFDAVRMKTDRSLAEDPPDLKKYQGSRYYAVKARYRDTGKGEPADLSPFYGLEMFTNRYKSMSQSILAEGRKEYLSGIEEKPVHLSTTRSEDLNVAKPSIYEAITGKEKQSRRPAE